MTSQPSDQPHYVARLVIERVEWAEGSQLVITSPKKERVRIITELGNVTVKSDALPGLITKIAQHSALIDDIGAIDARPNTKGNTR